MGARVKPQSDRVDFMLLDLFNQVLELLIELLIRSSFPARRSFSLHRTGTRVPIK